MKKFKVMLLASTAIFLQACSPYQTYEKSLLLGDTQESTQITLGEAQVINLYNVRKTIKISVKPPDNMKIYYPSNNLYLYETVLNINPRDKIAYTYTLENEKGEKKTIEFRLNTYQSLSARPINAQDIRVTSGKTKKTIGYTLPYLLASDQRATQIDLDELNNHRVYNFTYKGNVESLKINILPPKYMDFIIEGKPQKFYILNVDNKNIKEYRFDLRHMQTGEETSKILSFELQKINFTDNVQKNNTLKI